MTTHRNAIRSVMTALLAVAAVSSAAQSQTVPADSTKAPTIPAPSISPNVAVGGTSTSIVVAVSVPDPTLNPTSVRLMRAEQDGSASVVTRLNDVGTNGDLKPGDRVFSATVTLLEAKPGIVQFFVSANFQGHNAVSSPTSGVSIWQQLYDATVGVSVAFPPTWTVIPAAAGLLVSSISASQSLATESMLGLCKIGVIPIDKPIAETLADWRAIHANGPFSGLVSSQQFLLNGFDAIREVSMEDAETETVFIAASNTRVIAAELLCGDDVRAVGQRVFDMLVDTISPS